MNWTQIKCIVYSLTAAVIAWCVVGIISAPRSELRYSLMMAGRELATKTDYDRIIWVGPALSHELVGMLSSTCGVARVLSGDARAPIGDGTATGRVILTNATGKQLGIRLRRVDIDKFEVLGFEVTPTPIRR